MVDAVVTSRINTPPQADLLSKQDIAISEGRTANHTYSGLELLRIPRVADFLTSSPGTNLLLRSSDFTNTDATTWKALVRYLETEHGVTVALQTENNPHGYYALPDRTSQDGSGLMLENITAVRLVKTGRAAISRSPEESRANQPGLHFIHTNSMALALYNNDGWSDTFIIPSSDLSFAVPNSTALQYAQEAFEGLVASLDSDGNAIIFRSDRNAARFVNSCKAINAPPISEEQFMAAVQEVVRRNRDYIPQDGQLYIRPCIIGMEGGAGANSAKNYIFVVHCYPYGNYLQDNVSLLGRLDLSRPASGADKIGANYGPLFALKKAAKDGGFADILHFDSAGQVEECTASTPFFLTRLSNDRVLLETPFVRGDRGTSVHTENKHSLPSVTREAVIELSRRLGYEVRRRDIHFTSLQQVEAAFIVGTAVGVMPVSKIAIFNGNFHISDYTFELNNFDVGELANLLQRARKGELQGALADLNLVWTSKIT